MSGETEANVSGWTIDTLAQYHAAVRAADARFYEERDRRYTEVGVEREKALKIKETADLAALSLAREIQTYKDEKANELREQINRERGHYASKDDLVAGIEKVEATVKPLVEYVSGQRGGHAALTNAQALLLAAVTVVGVLLAAVALLTR